MRIAVIGTGAVGGYFGGRLAAAGEEVVFAARGRNAEAMRADGVRILSPLGDATVQPVTLLDDLQPAGWFDIVLLAVKGYHLPEAIPAVKRLLHVETAVIPLLNGVEAVPTLLRHLPERHVCGGIAYIAAALEAPGVVRHNGGFARLVFGEIGKASSRRLEGFEAACSAAGITATLADDIEAEIWRKFIMLAPFAAATSLAMAPIGPVRDDPAAAARLAAMVEETAAVAKASGARLPETIVADILALIGGLPATMRSSMLQDIEAGRPTELDSLAGAVSRLGRERGVATPETDRVVAALA